MKRFSLRLPDDLHRVLVQLAKRERRSLHSQILFILSEYINHSARADKTA